MRFEAIDHFLFLQLSLAIANCAMRMRNYTLHRLGYE